MSMTPWRLGASSVCAIPAPGKPNSNARTTHRMDLRNLIFRSFASLSTDLRCCDTRHTTMENPLLQCVSTDGSVSTDGLFNFIVHGPWTTLHFRTALSP